MEFFERAHVATKKQEFTKTSNKSDGKVKKQLKQMLYGYKSNDTELIIESANMKNDFDDSTSVSGFSDLNLTNSSCPEGDLTQKTLASDDDVSISDVSVFSLSDISAEFEVNTGKEHDKNTESTISEYNDDIQSLPEDITSNNDESSITEDELAFNASESSTESESQESEQFDPDGLLASKILNKLAKKKVLEPRKSAKKRKYEGVETGNIEFNINLDENGDSSGNKSNEVKQSDVSVDSTITDEDDLIEKFNGEVPTSKTPPYVSVIATESPNESLSEILGEYRYPTIKNLPTVVNQNVIFTANDSNTSSIHLSENSVEETAAEELDDNSSTILGDCRYSTVKKIPTVVNQNVLFTANDSNTSSIHLLENSAEETEAEKLDDSLVPEISSDQIDDHDFETSESEMPVDETTCYDSTMQTETTSDKDISIDTINTSFVNPVKAYYGKNTCIVVLRHPAELYFHGKVKVLTLWGTVEIFGYTLKNIPCEVYAPSYNYAQCIKTVENRHDNTSLFNKLTSAGLSVAITEDIVTSLAEYDSVIQLFALGNRKIEFVERYFTAVDLFGNTKKSIDSYFKKASSMLGCSLYISKPWKCLEEHMNWDLALRCGLRKQSRGIICGGKSTGKSTFLRYYVNRLLSQGPLLVLDLDPGQSEFTVAGNISATVVTEPLLGPNFTHLKDPEMMLNVGMISTMDNPRRYAAAVKTLIAYCFNNKNFQDIPWIVNTMGMCNSMGLKFIALIILKLQPTFLFQIDSRNIKKRFETFLIPQQIFKLYNDYQRDPIFKNVSCPDFDYEFIVSNHGEAPKNNLAPRDERYLNFLAYFGELFKTNRGDTLLGITPYQVKVQDLCIAVNVKVTEEAIKSVINGKIIALCQLNTHDKRRKVFTLGDSPLLCLGNGLVRAIDYEKQMMYIVTPVPADKLSSIDTILYADWVPELRGQEQQLPEGITVPYRTTPMHQQRQLMLAPRRRFNPLQLIKMSRSS